MNYGRKPRVVDPAAPPTTGLSDDELLVLMYHAVRTRPGPAGWARALEIVEREVRLRTLGELISRLAVPRSGVHDGATLAKRMIEEMGQ